MTGIDFNALAQAMDSSWGRSSTPRTASYSVKMTLQGESRLLVSYCAIINFGTERQMIDMKRRYEEEAGSVIAQVVKTVKANYKDISGESLTIKENAEPIDSIEMVSFNVHNPRRTAYFRRKVILEIA